MHLATLFISLVPHLLLIHHAGQVRSPLSDGTTQSCHPSELSQADFSEGLNHKFDISPRIPRKFATRDGLHKQLLSQSKECVTNNDKRGVRPRRTRIFLCFRFLQQDLELSGRSTKALKDNGNDATFRPRQQVLHKHRRSVTVIGGVGSVCHI